MEDTPRQAPLPSEELDLSVLLSKIGAFLKRNSFIFVVSCILGMGIATLICKSMPRTYTARMMMQSTILNPHEQQEMVSNWEQLLNPKGYDSLGRILSFDPAQLSSVSGIKVEVVGVASEGFTTSAVEVDTKDSGNLPALQQALINGFRNSDFVKRKVAVRKENLLEQIAKVKQQMATMDSSAEFVQSIRGKTGNSSYILDLSAIPEAQSLLQDKLAAYNEKLAFVDDMQVLQGFIRNKHSKPRLSIFLPAGLALGFFVGYIFAILKMVRTKGKKR